MSDSAKYIVVSDGGCECAIVFNRILSHRNVAGARTVLGAGFVDIIEDKAHVYGRSDTLNIDSRGEKDERAITVSLNLPR